MNSYTSNGLVWWDESEIQHRDALSAMLVGYVRRTLQRVNASIRVIRVETPCLMPLEWASNKQLPYYTTGKVALRAESTLGTYWVQEKCQYKLPVCLYQINKSFRDENSEAMRLSRLRFREFYQVEFQLFDSPDTKADYHQTFVDNFRFENLVPVEIPASELPPYSTRTTDLNSREFEVASLSTRKDFRVSGV